MITCDNPIVYLVLLTTLVGLYLRALTTTQPRESLDVWLKIGRKITHSLVKNYAPFGANVPAYRVIIACIPQLKYT